VFSPTPWVAVLVKNGDKFHGFAGHTEVHRVGKSAKQSSSNLVFDGRKLQRVFDDAAEDGVKFVEEFVSQSRPSRLVPGCRTADIEFSPGAGP
jgi:hypothetical protein